MTYKEAYEFGVEALNRESVLDAKLDARILLEYICQTDRSYLYVHGEEVVSEKSEKAYKESVKKRALRIPLQHIMGSCEFMGLSFFVNEDVLIPRQDTECLVEKIWQHTEKNLEILDVCTGSGCILLSILSKKETWRGVGSDISKKAIRVANENAKKLQIPATFIESDMFHKIEGKFDIIVSNPPYIKTSVIQELMPEVRDHDPRIALDGKEDGLHFYKILAKEAGNFLKKNGVIYVEIGYNQGKEVRALFEEEGFLDTKVYQDIPGSDRVIRTVYAG